MNATVPTSEQENPSDIVMNHLLAHWSFDFIEFSTPAVPKTTWPPVSWTKCPCDTAAIAVERKYCSFSICFCVYFGDQSFRFNKFGVGVLLQLVTKLTFTILKAPSEYETKDNADSGRSVFVHHPVEVNSEATVPAFLTTRCVVFSLLWSQNPNTCHLLPVKQTAVCKCECVCCVEVLVGVCWSCVCVLKTCSCKNTFEEAAFLRKCAYLCAEIGGWLKLFSVGGGSNIALPEILCISSVILEHDVVCLQGKEW